MGCCISILLPGVELPCTSLLHWDSFELLSGRGVATESCPLIHSLPLPMNPLVEVTLREFPWTLSEWCSASMVHNQHSVFHSAPHLKVLYSQIKICKQTCGSTHASWMLVGLVSVISPKFWCLQGS